MAAGSPQGTAETIALARKLENQLQQCLEKADWASMLRVLQRVARLNVSIELLKAVPVGKIVKKVSKKVPDKGCSELAEKIVARWKSKFQS